MNPTTEQFEALAVSEAEYEAIVERLGRQPNELAWVAFSPNERKPQTIPAFGKPVTVTIPGKLGDDFPAGTWNSMV